MSKGSPKAAEEKNFFQVADLLTTHQLLELQLQTSFREFRFEQLFEESKNRKEGMKRVECKRTSEDERRLKKKVNSHDIRDVMQKTLVSLCIF